MAGIRAINTQLKTNFAKDSLRMEGLLKKKTRNIRTIFNKFF